MIRKLLKIIVVLSLVFVGIETIAQEKVEEGSGYVLMTVNSDILCCPHFSYLLPQELENKKGIVLEKTDNKTYMLFKANSYSDSTSKEFYEIIKEIQFPITNIEKLTQKENYKDIIKLIEDK